MEEQSRRTRTPQPKRRHWVRWVITAILLVLFVAGGYEYYKIHHAASEIFDDNAKVDKQLQQGKPITILTLGLDGGALGRKNWGAGNTDSIEVITVNPQKETVRMTAIERDIPIKVKTDDGYTYVKLNAAYSLGGVKEVRKQVEDLLGIKIDYYASVDMGVLEKVVNAVGGVTVNNPFAFDYEGHHFKKGKQHLKGHLALQYTRMRYDDPRGDYGRQVRQQQVLKAVIKKFKDSGSIMVANKLLQAAGDGVRTDLPINAVATLYTQYKPALEHTQTDHLQGLSADIDGTSFQAVTPQELSRVSKNIRQSIGQKPVKLNNEEIKLYKYATLHGYNGMTSIEFPLPNGAHYNTIIDE